MVSEHQGFKLGGGHTEKSLGTVSKPQHPETHSKHKGSDSSDPGVFTGDHLMCRHG